MNADDSVVVVVLYYKYVQICETLDALEAFAREHRHLCASLGLTGRVRLALEGINGTLGGTSLNVQRYVEYMQTQRLFTDIDWKTSASATAPFADLRVRVVAEIVALEVPSTTYDLTQRGHHLSPDEFRAEQLQSDPTSIAVIDVRNAYEVQVGHFAHALNPNTRRFGQFPQWAQDHLHVLEQKQKVLLYCTGGIRCEKASAYLKGLGLANVFQLAGGIHRFLERFPDGGGLFQGKNFVFDQRGTLASSDEAIIGQCAQCHAPHDTVSGVRCAYCRMHVLLCDACRTRAAVTQQDDESQQLVDVFCNEHLPLVSGSLEELHARVALLEEELQRAHGRRQKGRRRSLRKQVDTVTKRIQRRQQVPETMACVRE
ncbi:unnamed protein product [Hyaloperonospora brassicae]|uniref:Rhodanese domain-containing protein n=1 Tax=Hyaloperonospora brassicae TaxID=162125 RepID=A0AAV0TBH8_HYABA|nr:unnamed protein product [Hyaloperonospora brassicae]